MVEQWEVPIFSIKLYFYFYVYKNKYDVSVCVQVDKQMIEILVYKILGYFVLIHTYA